MDIIKFIQSKQKELTYFKGDKTLKRNIYQLEQDDFDKLKEQLLLYAVVFNEANKPKKETELLQPKPLWKEYDTDKENSEVAFNCFEGNYAKGIKPCVEHCGEDICLKPSN